MSNVIRSQKVASAYTCPKCLAPYCSVQCYRSHGSECVASFHNAALAQALKGETVSPHDQTAVHAMLQRQFEQEREEEEEQFDDAPKVEHEQVLIELLEKMSTESFDPTVDVPPFLREQFMREIGNVLPAVWEPWWIKGSGASGVDVQYDVTTIPVFSTLNGGRDPSPLLPLISLDILFSFAYVCRRFNGEHLTERGAVALLIELCEAFHLPPKAPASSFEQWHMEARRRANEATLGARSIEQTQLALKDLSVIVSSCSHVIRSLWETHVMLASHRQDSRHFEFGAKKALFFLSWAVSLRPDLSSLFQRQLQELV